MRSDGYEFSASAREQARQARDGNVEVPLLVDLDGQSESNLATSSKV